MLYCDVGILLYRKYLLPYAIDTSVGATPELGDDVIAYGYGDHAKVWGVRFLTYLKKTSVIQRRIILMVLRDSVLMSILYREEVNMEECQAPL